MKRKIVKFPVSNQTTLKLEEVATVTLPYPPKEKEERTLPDGRVVSDKLLGGESSIMVDADLDEMKRFAIAERFLAGLTKAASAAGYTSHVGPYVEAVCKVAKKEGSARAEKARHDKAVKNGKVQSKHLKPVNEERARQCPDYRPALKFARELAARTPGAKPHGFWKELLTEVDAKHPGIFNTSEALRKAVCRSDAERRGKHERTGKKRGRYHR